VLVAGLCGCDARVEPTTDGLPNKRPDAAEGTSVPEGQVAGLRCNGHSYLCERELSSVAFPATRYSFATIDEFGPALAHQRLDVGEQLNYGIRALHLEVHRGPAAATRRGPVLCRAPCDGPFVELVPVLRAVAEFALAHRREVILLLVNAGWEVSPEQLVDAITDSGLRALTYPLPSGRETDGGSWPRLRELIAANQRVVIFASFAGGQGGAIAPGIHSMWAHIWQSAPEFAAADRLGCDRPLRRARAEFYWLHHAARGPAVTPSDAAKLNAWPGFLARVRQCEQIQLPNIVAVDFFLADDRPDDGRASVVDIAAYLNGVGVQRIVDRGVRAVNPR
jgi:hypothetical protein